VTSQQVGPARVTSQQQPTETQTQQTKKKMSAQDAARIAQQPAFTVKRKETF